MKKIFSILMLTISLVACSQNQTFTGVKTFTSPPKFKNLIQNDLNTKVLTINPTNVLQWRDAASLSTIPSLQQVTDVGNITTNNLQVGIPLIPFQPYQFSRLSDNDFLTAYSNGSGTNLSLKHSAHGIELNNNNGYYEILYPYDAATTESGTIRFPMPAKNGDETLITDAPSDGSNYVRNNSTWVQIPASNVPTLDDVLYSGNTASLNIIRNYSTGVPGNQTTYSTTLDPNFLEVKAFYQGTSSEDKTEYRLGYIKQNSFTYNFPANSGTFAVINSTGTANTGLGDGALDATPSTASYNLAVGVSAATALTGGSQNTAIGNYAMYASTTATGNVAVGTSALQNHTTGNYNTAVGFHALESRVGNLTGSSNIGVGLQAGRAVTTGSNNILIENTTNDGISTGSFNIILDGRNKSGVTTGSGNVIIGGYDGVFPAAMAETIVIGTGTGTQRFKIDSTGKTFVLGAINVGAAPTYADNTAALAAGLVAGDVYKTATGVLMITY